MLPTRTLLLLLLALLLACGSQEERQQATRARFEEAVANQDAGAALEALDDLRDELPDTPETTSETARLLARVGEMNRALWLLEEAARRHPARNDLRLGIAETTRHRYGPALLTTIDAAFENPELTAIVVRSVGSQGDDKARHFLLHVLENGTTENKNLAARALATIGRRAKASLKTAALSDDPEVRTIALRALVPVTDPDDLTMLYEYLGRYADDDPILVDLVRSRAAQIEEFLDAREEAGGGA